MSSEADQLEKNRLYWQEWNKQNGPIVVGKKPKNPEFVSSDSSLNSRIEAEQTRVHLQSKGGSFYVVLHGGLYYVVPGPRLGNLVTPDLLVGPRPTMVNNPVSATLFECSLCGPDNTISRIHLKPVCADCFCPK